MSQANDSYNFAKSENDFMKNKTIEATLFAAIKKLNDAFSALGLEACDRLPIGVRNSNIACPVANAFRERGIEVYVNNYFISVRERPELAAIIARTWRKGHWGHTVRMPRSLEKIVYLIDNGAFPSLLS